jgi:Ulp1 family protease
MGGGDMSVLTTRNDPDYFRLTKTRFQINKSYMDFIQGTLQLNNTNEVKQRRGSMTDEPVIKNERLNFEISRPSFNRLKPGKWLNDEVINAYIKLINDRSAQRGL